MPTISLCMIVRNEEEVLSRCLDSVHGLVDEIIIVDTGSTDSTIEIARRHGAHVHHFEWIDDFAAARNFSFSHASSDYIMWLDADDVVLPGDLARLVELKPGFEADLYYMPYNYAQDAAGNSLCTLHRERIMRRGIDAGWAYPIHECVVINSPIDAQRLDVTITHMRTHAGAEADQNRNLRILEKAIEDPQYKDVPRIHYYLGREYQDMGNEPLAIETYRRFLRMTGGWAEDYLCAQQRIARCYMALSLKDTPHAVEHRNSAHHEARLAKTLDKRWAEPYYVLGQVAFEEGDYEEAIFMFKQCLRPYPEVLSPLDTHSYGLGPAMGLVFACDKLGRYEEANEYNELALRYLPDDPGLVFNRGYFLSRLNERKRPTGPVKLNLGSGNKRYLDYTNCDKYPGREVDEIFSLDRVPYEDGTVDAIHSEHALEHVRHMEARRALREWYRVLKPGGELHLQLPDLEACCRRFLEAQTQAERDWYRYTIYGIQCSQGDEPDDGQIHYTGFTEEELVRELEEIGFRVEHHGKYDGYGTPSIEVLAHKPALSAVDIIIPTYNSREHLALTVESVIACTDHPHRIIVVNSGPEENTASLPQSVVVITMKEQLNFAETVNVGIAASRSTAGGGAPYLCFLNDDVIVSKGWLTPLVEAIGGEVGLSNPLSNCDKGWWHDYDLEIDGLPLLPSGNTLHEGTVQVKGIDAPGIDPKRLHDARFPYGGTRRMKWLAFFCTVVSREVIERVGLLDEGFVNGGEDLDYCRRAARMGYACAIDESSFVFHFGGTSHALEDIKEPGTSAAEWQSNETRMWLKYERPLLVIHTGNSFEPWTSANIHTTGIGGSETAAARMAEEFVELGYRVVVFSLCPDMEGTCNGVEYLDYSRFERFADMHYIDVFIASRYVPILLFPIRARKIYLWIHDVRALGTDLGENDLVRQLHDRIDGIFCLSPWHRDFFAQMHGIPADKIILTGNGIDPERFARDIPKQENRFIYASSPDRGLDTLLEIWPLIMAAIPNAELHVFYGFDTWDRDLANSGDEQGKRYRDQIHAGLSQPGVFNHGRVGQLELAEEFLKSDIWFYPTRFTETYCITALEAQMAGTLCICTDLAGLSTTVADRGVLLAGDPHSRDYIIAALRELFALTKDPERKESLTLKARRWAMEQTWRNRALQWHEVFALEVAAEVA
jgi:glycosyltransferase involved in cell wall biosynthesis